MQTSYNFCEHESQEEPVHSATTHVLEDHPHDQNPSFLRTLNEFAVDLISIPNASDLFWYVAQNVVGRLGFVDCVIYTADTQTQKLTQVAALGEKNPYGRKILNPLVIPFGEGITGKTAQTAKPTIVDDLLLDANYIEDAQPARSEICVPLLSKGDVVGVIDSEHPQAKAFGPAELEILTTVAAMTSAKLELLHEADQSQRRYADLVKMHAMLSDEICSRKAVEAELHEARRREAVGQLTGRLAHDFNNLLTVISNNLELVEAYFREPSSRKFLKDASVASHSAARLVSDLLAFAEKSRLTPVDTDMNRLVRDLCAVSVLPNTITLDLHLSAIDLVAQTDPAAAKSAINAIMSNAIEAMPDGGTLTVSTDIIGRNAMSRSTLPADLNPGIYISVKVTDTGHGVPPELLQQIFDPFFSTKHVGSGRGLGLASVQGFMAQSGGAVMASANSPVGTSVELFFPIRT
ncbi:ATP-binding protein [Marivita sp.]|uniref:ATP-binding protein n=1 Tax=Marivita sp. TaxID=2003365 RepID=UPI0025C38FD8|nr:ATP-binding protein [Marivita sp.]